MHISRIPTVFLRYVLISISRLTLNAISLLHSQSIQSEVDEFADVKLEDLKEIATLGVGGFGRVELVFPLYKIFFQDMYFLPLSRRLKHPNLHFYEFSYHTLYCLFSGVEVN